MIRHMRHGSPPRLLALQSILSPNRRESLPTPSAGVRIIQHGRREHHFERNDVAKIGAGGESFDVALYPPAHEKSRFENRWQSAVLLDRNQNGLHGRHPNPEQGCSWQDTSNRRSTN